MARKKRQPKVREWLAVVAVGAAFAVALVAWGRSRELGDGGLAAVATPSPSAAVITSVKDASPSLADPRITIEWQNKSSAGLSNAVYRSVDKKEWQYLAKLGAKETSYTDRTPKKGTKYYYVISTILPGNDEVRSSESKAIAAAAHKEILVVLADFNDVRRAGWTESPDKVRRKVTGDKDSVYSYWMANSYGKLKDFSADVTEWLHVDADIAKGAPCSASGMPAYLQGKLSAAGKAAENNGYMLAEYSKVIFVTPGDIQRNCRTPYQVVPGVTVDLNGSSVAGNRIFINGEQPAAVYAQEYGHIIQSGKYLPHVVALNCGSKDVIGDLSKCAVMGSGIAPYTLMGRTGGGHVLAVQKDALGYLTPPKQSVAKTGYYKISAMGSASAANPRALAVRSPGSGFSYMIEYRQPVGLDATAAFPQDYDGIWITTVATSTVEGSAVQAPALMAFGPNKSVRANGGINGLAGKDGSVFLDDVDPARTLRITQTRHAADYAVVCVEFGKEACDPKIAPKP